MSDYWQRRKHLPYYQRVIEYAQRYCPDGKTLLDVGGGVGYGCRFLESFTDFARTSVELPTEGQGHTLEGVRLINEDFLNWKADRRYDLVLCMQVLEHIPDVVTFVRKLFGRDHIG